MNISEQDIAKLLISSSPEGILIVNQKGKIVLVNNSLISMFGYSNQNELLGEPMEILLPKKYKEGHVAKRDSFAKHPSKRRMGGDRVLFGKRKDDSEFAVEIGLNHIETENGILTSALLTDVSERVEIQNKLTKLNAELEHKVNERTQELENAILELQETNNDLENQFDRTKKAESEAKIALEKEKELGELKSRFVSMASHEFRTPLSTVLSSNSLINKYLEKESISSSIKIKIDKHNSRIANSIKNLNEVLNDLLSLGKIEEGKIVTKNEKFCITDLYDELSEEMSTYLKKGQSIEVSHVGFASIKSDRHLLHNILINLTSNASKYSNEGKSIKIISSNKDNILIIEVIDQGIGIPNEDDIHMFDRFFRAKNATNIEGTGLGLNIVKKYLELIKGDISYTSELNVGSTFTIKINL